MTEFTPFQDLRILEKPPSTAIEVDIAAVRAVCQHAKDADDAGELLAMLGLIATPERREEGGYCPATLAWGEAVFRRAQIHGDDRTGVSE